MIDINSSLWFLLFIILIIIEIISLNLLTIWFAIAALVTGIISLFIDSTIIQMLIFIILSFITLIISRPFIKKVRIKTIVPTNLDRIIGTSGIVVQDIEKYKVGEVKVDGKVWSAISDDVIQKGSIVKILAIDGVKLKVEKSRGE